MSTIISSMERKFQHDSNIIKNRHSQNCGDHKDYFNRSSRHRFLREAHVKDEPSGVNT
jgi:hypothetical protein